MSFGARLLSTALVCLLAAGVVSAREPSVWVATSGEGVAYSQTIEALARQLPEAEIKVVPWREIAVRQGGAPAVIVTLGLDALKHITQATESWPRTSIVALLVPRYGLESLPRTGSPRTTGVYLDQPFSRQMQWLRSALPGRSRVGVVLGPNSQVYAREIRHAAKQAGLEPVIKVVESRDDVAPALQAVLPESDVYFAVPDSVVFGSQMIQYVLIASYRHGVPVVGYSAPMVKAGALAALVASPEQIGRQGAQLTRKVLNGTWPPFQAPDDYEVKVNASVARALDLDLDEVAQNRKSRGTGGGP